MCNILGKKKNRLLTILSNKYLITSLSKTPSDFLGAYHLAPNERADLFLKHTILVCTEVNPEGQSVLLFQGTLSQMEQEEVPT